MAEKEPVAKFSQLELETVFRGIKKKPPVLIKCDECGTEIRQVKKWQRFCSDGCRSAWHANWKDREIAKLRAELEGQK